jgi:hypothetical protein
MTHYTTVNEDEYHQINIGDKTFLVMDNDIYLPADKIEIREESTEGKAMICFIDAVQKDCKGIESGCSVISIRSTEYELDLN